VSRQQIVFQKTSLLGLQQVLQLESLQELRLALQQVSLQELQLAFLLEPFLLEPLGLRLRMGQQQELVQVLRRSQPVRKSKPGTSLKSQTSS
jgi:hypothetical protein